MMASTYVDVHTFDDYHALVADCGFTFIGH
jgi:hypothetical protein